MNEPVDPRISERLDRDLTRFFARVDTSPGFEDTLLRKLVAMDPSRAVRSPVAGPRRVRFLETCARAAPLVLALTGLVGVIVALWPVLQAAIDQAMSGSLASGDSTGLVKAAVALFAIVVTAILFTSPGSTVRRAR